MSTSTNVGSNARMQSIVFTTFIVSSILVNAALTGQFGWEHAGGIFGALIMLLFFDGAALAWFLARKEEGLSSMQRGIAKLMSIGTIIASTLVSVIQVLLNTTLVTFSPSELALIGKGGLILVTAAAACNFLALFAFAYYSLAERKAEEVEESKARAADERQDMIKEAHTKAHTKARARLMLVTDAVAERMANDAEREFYSAMDCMDMYEPPVPTTKKVDMGAAAGAKKGKKKKTKAKKSTSTLPAAELAEDCDCGMPIGSEAGECLGGDECMIDIKAAEQKAEREALEAPLDIFARSPLAEPIEPGK